MLKKIFAIAFMLAISARAFASDAYVGNSGGQAGLGLQTHLNKNLDLQSEYDFIPYESIDGIERNKISPTSGDIKLGLIFRIN